MTFYDKIISRVKRFHLCSLQILRFLDQDFLPQRFDCGEVVTFHVGSLLASLKTQGNGNAIEMTEHAISYYTKKSTSAISE